MFSDQQIEQRAGDDHCLSLSQSADSVFEAHQKEFRVQSQNDCQGKSILYEILNFFATSQNSRRCLHFRHKKENDKPHKQFFLAKAEYNCSQVWLT